MSIKHLFMGVVLIPGALVVNGCMGLGMMTPMRVKTERIEVKPTVDPQTKITSLLDAAVDRLPEKLNDLQTLAVVQVKGNSDLQTEEWMISYLENKLTTTTDYQVVDRTVILKILDENSLSLNGITSGTGDWKAGELLPADGLVTGMFSSTPSGMELILKIISTRSGAILWSTVVKSQ